MLHKSNIWSNFTSFIISQPIKADILFVHGLLGAAFKTWRQKDCDTTEDDKTSEGIRDDYTECWPKVKYFCEHRYEWSLGVKSQSCLRWNSFIGLERHLESLDLFFVFSTVMVGYRLSKPQNPVSGVWHAFKWLEGEVSCRKPKVRGCGVKYAYCNLLYYDYLMCLFFWYRKSLAYRSQELLRKLKDAGVGDRPVVWVAHSMGG